jgi:hypothetical protein
MRGVEPSLTARPPNILHAIYQGHR